MDQQLNFHSALQMLKKQGYTLQKIAAYFEKKAEGMSEASISRAAPRQDFLNGGWKKVR